MEVMFLAQFMLLAEQAVQTDVTALQKVNEIWAQIMPYFTMIVSNGTLLGIGTTFLRSSVSRMVKKINIQALIDEAIDKAMNRVKEMTLHQDIQPIVEHRLEEIEGKLMEKYEQNLKEMQENQVQLVLLMQAFISYFDDSIGVPEEKKALAKQLVQEALEKAVKPCDSVETVVQLEEKTKHHHKKETASIER